MTTLRVGCLGAGYFAQFHHEAWARIDGAELVAVADRDLDKAAASGAEPYDSLEAMLEQARPDILDIVTPPDTHLAAIKAGLDAGVAAIICQKPFCAELETARRATEMAEAAGIPLIVHENFRFQPWFRTIREQIDSGVLGTLHNLSFRLRPGDGQGPRAYLDRQPYFQKMERFLIHETAVHFIDVFRYLLGPINGVYADLRRLNQAIAGEDAGHVLFDCADGMRALFDGNRHLDHVAKNHRLTMGEALIEGTEASLFLNGDGAVFLRRKGETKDIEIMAARDWPGFAGDCVHALQSHVIAHLRDGTQLENTARDYLTVLEVEDAIYASAKTRSHVVLGRD